MGRDPAWLILLVVVAALAAASAAVAAPPPGRPWLFWGPAFALLAVTIGLLLAARGVPAGATRDFFVWLALAAWVAWAAWQWLGRQAVA